MTTNALIGYFRRSHTHSGIAMPKAEIQIYELTGFGLT